MLKTIKLDEKTSITLSNNASWTMIYLEQFGHDIVPDIMPAVSAVANLVAGLAEGMSAVGEKIELKDVAKVVGSLSGDSLSDAFVELAGLRFVDLIHITWAMAKAADDDIDTPKEWVRGFETFPVDVIVPEIFDMVLSGMASSKNLKRLRKVIDGMKTKTEPSDSTTYSSQDKSEG